MSKKQDIFNATNPSELSSIIATKRLNQKDLEDIIYKLCEMIEKNIETPSTATEPSQGEINNLTGLTWDEQKVMDSIVSAYNTFIEIPHHVTELELFVQYIHGIQDLLAARIGKRNFPKGWN